MLATSISMPALLLVLKATMLLVAALGITFALQRAPAGMRHLVWLITLAAIALVPALATWTPVRLAILPASSAAAPAPTTDAKADASSSRAAALPAPSGAPAATLAVAPPSTPQRDPVAALHAFSRFSPFSAFSALGTGTLLLLAWGTVALLLLLSLVRATLMVRRIVRRASALTAPDWVDPLYEVADRLELRDAPRLLRSADVAMPFACGIVHPTVVLPADCDTWTLDRRRAVLLHELAHVRRNDLLGHTLGRLVCAAWWFHPLVWTAAKRLRAESERACDDLALACGARAADYAEHLLDIVTSARRDHTPSVALAMARRKEFEGRMLAILDPELPHGTPSRRQSMALAGTLALLALVVGAAAPAPREATAATVAQAAAGARAQATATADYLDSTPAGVSVALSGPAPAPTKELREIADARAQAAATAPSDDDDGRAEALAERLKDDRGIALSTDERPALLAKILRTDTSATLRRIAAWGLAEHAKKDVAVDALAEALRRDDNESVREMAAWALAEAQDDLPMVASALGAALRNDASVRVRRTAAWALGNHENRSATDALVAALADASPDVRMRAIWALGNVEPRQAPPALVAFLRDREPRVRQLTAWALYAIEDPATAPALDAALRAEQDPTLQMAYLRALAAMGEKSVDAIRRLLDSSDPRVKGMAVRALAGGDATGPWPWPWPEPRPHP